MKIVIAVHHFPPRYRAGAELRAYDAACWLQSKGHNVSVLCVEYIDRGPENGVSWEDTRYNGLKVRRLAFDLSKAPDRFRWEYCNPWIEEHLRVYLSEVKPDIFHLFSGYIMGAGAIQAAKANSLPVVITLTDFWFFCPRISLQRPDGHLSDPGRYNREDCTRCRAEEKRRFRYFSRYFPGIANLLWKYVFRSSNRIGQAAEEIASQFDRRNQKMMEMLRTADALISPSSFVAESFLARGIAAKKLFLNPHGIDAGQWILANMDNGRTDGVLRIGYLGQVEPHKGVHILFEAFSLLKSDKPMELVVYGRRPTSAAYEKQLERILEADPRVMIYGAYEPQQLGQILSQIDLLVIPSTWNEIGPLVMYEALQAKKPVVASNIPNMSSVIQHEKNGLLFEMGSSADLATQLQRLLDEPDLLVSLKAGIEPVKTIDDEMLGIQGIYNSLVKVENRSI